MHLEIDVPPASRVEGLVVDRDGEHVSPAEWGVLVPVDEAFDRATLPVRFDNQDRACADLVDTGVFIEANLGEGGPDAGVALTNGRLGGRLDVGSFLEGLLRVRAGSNRERSHMPVKMRF